MRKTNTNSQRKMTCKPKTHKTKTTINNNKISNKPKPKTTTNPTAFANGCKPTTNNPPPLATCPSNNSSKTNKTTCLKSGPTTNKTSSKINTSNPPNDSPSAATTG